MTTGWSPTLGSDGAPRYVALADAIAKGVEEGVLVSGQKLPTHRALARELGVTVGTVTRGYAEAERRGLTVGEVGRGTFVRGGRVLDAFEPVQLGALDDDGVVDLSLALPWIPPGGEDGRALARALQACAASACPDELLAYQAGTALPRHLAVGASWLAGLGVSVPPERVVVTAGAQHGLLVALSSLLSPGAVLLTGEVTYPGIKSVARLLGIRIRGVPQDEEGIVPEEMDRICREAGARALYTIPTLQNPACTTMSEERRIAVAEVAWSHDLAIVEDDVYAPIAATGLPTLQSLAPERTVHLATLSKALTFGLRVGFVAAPEAWVERLRAAIRSTVWMAPPFMVDVACRWITDGTAEDMMERRRVEAAARHAILREALGARWKLRSHPRSMHAWLTLPEPWRAEDFVAAARERGVRLAGAEAFAAGRHGVPHAVRICMGPVPLRERFREAVETLAELLADSGSPYGGIL